MSDQTDSRDPRPAASVADPYLDLLEGLSYGLRQGLVQRLATGYYDGWRPSRFQVAELIAGDGSGLSVAERQALFERARGPLDPTRIAPVARPVTVPRQERINPPGRNRTAAGTHPDTGPLPAAPRTMVPCTAACGPLTPRTEFVARGLSSGPWITRANRVCRMISLHYELVGRPDVGYSPNGTYGFTGTILCQPDVPAPQEPGDGTTARQALRAGRVIGVRGAWPISAKARRVGFVLYPEATMNDVGRHPAGTLMVDLRSNRALWWPRAQPAIEIAPPDEPMAEHG